MINEEQKIKCPKCGTSISIDDVLTRQIEEKVKSGLAEEQKAKELELENKSVELKKKELAVVKAQKSVDDLVTEKVAEKITVEKAELIRQSKLQATKEKEAEFKILEEQLKEKDDKLAVANTEALKFRIDKQKFEEKKKGFELEKLKQIEEERQKIESEAYTKALEFNKKEIVKLQKQIVETDKSKEDERKLLEEQLAEKEVKLRESSKKELEIRKERNKLEEDQKNFELEKQRQLDEERKVIVEEASKKANEEQQYVIAQLKKQLTDATIAKDDLARKLEQGSQQTQGEVLELKLEEILKEEFPQDEIAPVPKGVNGADIIQKVYDYSGRLCGQIVWEAKKAKNWKEDWIVKLKDDQRAIKAELAVIVSTVLPEDIKGFKLHNGIWVCDIKLAVALASVLRTTLEVVTREKAMSVGKDRKMEILYSYLTGVEFQQRIEAIIEGFTNMKKGLDKEKLAYQKIWAEREKQIQKVINNTVGMYGDLSGLAPLQHIKMLELGEGENKEIINS